MRTPARKIGAGALVALLLAVCATVAGATPAFTGAGGLEGMRYVPQPANNVYEPTEAVTLDFDAPVDLTSFNAALTIEPGAAARATTQSYGKRVVVQFRKRPGTTYHVHVAAGVRATDGSVSTAPIDIVVKTASPGIPAPIRATPGEPYRYGVLAHPYPASLGGPDADRIIGLMADAGVRFVRIDYSGDQIEHTAGQFDFSIEDRIADKLAARGITELPIVLQYSAPAWATGGAKYPAIWRNPALYSAFAGAVATHLAQRYPKITRVELFNEPNLDGWWSNPADPAYASNDGSATALYMRGAYAAVKAAAPHMTIVGPALAAGGKEVDPRTFFEHLYTAGCRRGVCWDVLSAHNYRWENPTFEEPPGAANRFDIYKAILAIAAAHGDAGTHMMLTEWGYSTDASADGVDPQTQALYVALGLNLMLSDPLVDGIVYVNMYNPSPDFWGQTALVSSDFTPKPAYDVYRTFARDR